MEFLLLGVFKGSLCVRTPFRAAKLWGLAVCNLGCGIEGVGSTSFELSPFWESPGLGFRGLGFRVFGFCLRLWRHEMLQSALGRCYRKVTTAANCAENARTPNNVAVHVLLRFTF